MGTICSVLEWSSPICAQDEGQKCSFEIIIACFLLTFYDKDTTSADDPTADAEHRQYFKIQDAFRRLQGLPENDVLAL